MRDALLLFVAAMIVADIGLHVTGLVMLPERFVIFHSRAVYECFWIAYWTLALVLVISALAA